MLNQLIHRPQLIVKDYTPSSLSPEEDKSSFIHIEHLYSASSRELLRGAPDSSTAKRSSLKVGKKRRWQTLLSGSIVWSRRL